MNRERRDDSGTRPITRRVQRGEAQQMRDSPHREEMAELCGQTAFEHYIRTDRIGARPLPEEWRHVFKIRGWLTEVSPCDCPVEPAGIVLDPFGGSGTTAMVAIQEGRQAIVCELNPAYIPMIRRRCDVTPGFDFSYSPTT